MWYVVRGMPEKQDVLKASPSSLEPDRDTGSHVPSSAAMHALWEQGRQCWPGVEAEQADFYSAVIDRLRASPSSGDGLAELDAGELYVACACSARDPQAVAALEQRYFPAVEARLASMKLPADVREDIRQAVREKLLVSRAANEPPPIHRYAGAGRLAHLLRVVAFREAISHLRRNRPDRTRSDDLLDLPTAAADPYLARARSEHTEAFRRAFAAAVTKLEPRERTILRLRFLDGLAVSEIARLYRVHRVTASRWFVSARRKVEVGTRQGLRARLDISDSELDAFMEHVETEPNLSLERLLRSQLGEAASCDGPARSQPGTADRDG